jgi:hypothetical protein
MAEARARLVRRSGDPVACAQFEAGYAGSAQAAKLQPACEELEWQAARKSRTRLALEFYLKRYPGSARAAEAQKLLAALPRVAAPGDAVDALELLPQVRATNPALRGYECLQALAADMRASSDPMSRQAEDERAKVFGALRSQDPSRCWRDMTVPAAHRADVGAAIRALGSIYQRQARLAAVFGNNDKLADQAREIGGSSAKLASDSEAFELELQAYFGYMPADPDNPKEKASKSAQDAERRAHRAYELAEGGALKSKRDEAAQVLRAMDGEADLLTRVIAYYETPAGSAR